MPDIKDIAKLADVSVATVSRVLNNSENVSDKTRKKVTDIIESVGYEPSSLGRNLRRQNTKIILVILTTLENPFYSKVLSGIEKRGQQDQYSTIIASNNNDERQEEVYISMLKRKQVDGIIMMGSKKTTEELEELGAVYNIVQCAEYKIVENIPYVSADNEGASYDITKYLIGDGRDKIAIVGTKDESSMSSYLRQKGFLKAMQDSRLNIYEHLFVYGEYSYSKTYEEITKLLNSGEELPNGIFAMSDKMAAACINAIKDHGLRVPEDISVVGFDNIDIAKMISPHITTVSQAKQELGYMAMDMLIDMINNGDKRNNMFIPHEIVVRESTRNMRE